MLTPARHVPRSLALAAASLASFATLSLPASHLRAALLPAPLTAREPGIIFKIESVARDMAAAAIAADRDGYLAIISRSDPEFYAEQVYFANDFVKKPPQECAFRFENIALGDTVARGTMHIEWKMPGKQSRTVSFPASFLLEDGQWRYAGEVWDRIAGDRIGILYIGDLGDLAGRVADSFAEVRSHVEDGFMMTDGELPRKTQNIKIYRSMRHLQASISLSYSDALSGWNEPNEPIKILANNRAQPNTLRPLLAHEYAHVATFLLGPTATNMPWWILEGVAELSAEKWGSRPDGLVQSWAKADRIAPWEALADFENIEPRWRGHVYRQGHHMLGYISDTFGRDARVRWLTDLAQGKTLDVSSSAAFGIPFTDLDAQWRATLPAAENAKPEIEPPPEPATP
jgi:hypothetical protein